MSKYLWYGIIEDLGIYCPISHIIVREPVGGQAYGIGFVASITRALAHMSGISTAWPVRAEMRQVSQIWTAARPAAPSTSG